MLHKRSEQDFADEIEAHLRLEADQLIEEGMAPHEAMAAARRRFGNVTLSQERFYESNRWLWLDHLLRNTRYALRQLRGAPVTTAAILLSLALGVGLNTSIFSLTDQALIRPLPVENPETLVQLEWDGKFVVSGMGSVGYGNILPFPLYRKLREETQVLRDIFARTGAEIHLGSRGESSRVHAELVTGAFFSTLGVRPALGKLLGESEDTRPDGHPQVVLSHAFWQSHFGGDPGVVGDAILINNHPMTVLGVAEPGFHGVDWSRPASLWVPMRMKGRITSGWTGFDEHRSRFAHVYARLSSGVTRQQAEAQLGPWFKAYLKADTERSDWPSVTDEQFRGYLSAALRIHPGARGQSHLAEKIERPMYILAGACGLVLLLACLNVANLSLARAFASRRDTALRTALGASRRRILGESLVESAVLALFGAGLGALSAPPISRFILTLLPAGTETSVVLRPDLDLRVLSFALGLTVLVTLLAGAAPALFTASMKPIEALRKRSAGSTGALSLRKALVVAQFTLALVLLIGAGLFARTLATLRSTGPGYSTGHLLSFRLAPVQDGTERAETNTLIREVRERLEQTPEIAGVGVAYFEMLTGSGWNNPVTLAAEGGRVATDRSLPMNAVTPGFFAALGVPVLAGRDFRETDAADHGWDLRTAIVNQELVERYLDGQNPIGAQLAFGVAPNAEPDIEIVGVVRGFQDYGLRERAPQVFFPLWQLAPDAATFYVRARVSSETAAQAVRRAVREADPGLTVFSLRTVDDQIDRMLVNERILATLATAFAALATLLAMIGLYGVLSFSAESRKKEMGIRIALGAPRGSAGGLILREALTLAASGLLLALPAVWALGRLIESQLFGVHPTDAATSAAAALVLLLLSLLAGALPARQIGRMHPLDALRRE